MMFGDNLHKVIVFLVGVHYHHYILIQVVHGILQILGGMQNYTTSKHLTNTFGKIL